MLYCDSCSRILDEDVRFCPLCNREDPDWQEYKEPEYVPHGVFRGEAFDRLRKINQHLDENPPEPARLSSPEEKPSDGLYVMLILMSVCLSIVGLIIGIVYASKKNKHFQSMGIVAIVVSSVFLVFGLIFIASLIIMANLI